MNKKIISATLALAFACSSLLSLPVSTARAADGTEKKHPASDIVLEEGTYEEGQVLLTIAAPEQTPLTEEGDVSFDSRLTVEDSWEFGTADVLAETEKQKDFLQDKTLYIVKVSSDSYSTSELLSRLDSQAYVVNAEPDYLLHKLSVSNDALADYQWYLGNTDTFSSSTSAGIRYTDYSQPAPSKTPIVAVVDTGIDYTHEDLAGHMWKNTHASLQGTYGYDFGDYDSDPMDTDEDGHGTHCAGVIGAVGNNSSGITGIASDVKLMALKVFNQNDNCYSSSVIAAFEYIYKAQELGENIVAVNCSWGGGNSTPASMAALIEKIGKKGSLFIFASGNDGKSHDSSSQKTCPYDLDSPYTVIVGASMPDDTRATYSDYGASDVDFFSPGYHILSSVNKNVFTPSIYTDAKRQELCSYYSACDSSDIPLYTSDDVGESSLYTVDYHGISHVQTDYFGKNTGSYKVSFSSSSFSTRLALYIDVTSLNLDPSEVYYTSCDLGLPDKGAINWEHGNYQRSYLHFVKKDDKTYLLLVGLEGKLSSFSSIYVDNIAISKANPDTNQFGKYNIYDGTSMAAPSATAAVALLAGAYPSDTAIQRRERLMTCVRKTDSLSSFCRTGGVLDLGKIPTATYTTTSGSKTTAKKKVKVSKVKLNKKKATLRYKKKLKLKATVTPAKASNKKVKWYVSNKKYASVTQKGIVKAKKKGIGHTVKVYAKAKDGSGKKAYCKIKIKKKK